MFRLYYILTLLFLARRYLFLNILFRPAAGTRATSGLMLSSR